MAELFILIKQTHLNERFIQAGNHLVQFNERELDLLMNFMGLIINDYETNRIQFLHGLNEMFNSSDDSNTNYIEDYDEPTDEFDNASSCFTNDNADDSSIQFIDSFNKDKEPSDLEMMQNLVERINYHSNLNNQDYEQSMSSVKETSSPTTSKNSSNQNESNQIPDPNEMHALVRNMKKNFPSEIIAYLDMKYLENKFPNYEQRRIMSMVTGLKEKQIQSWFEKRRVRLRHVKPKQRFSLETVEYLNEVFKTNRNPNLDERNKISEVTNLTEKQIQMWFFNRRLKSPLSIDT